MATKSNLGSNYGQNVKIKTINNENVGTVPTVVITGTSIGTSALSSAGDEVKIRMSADRFNKTMAHNMARNMKSYAQSPTRFADSTVAFYRCYKKDGEIQSYGGVTMEYVVDGEPELRNHGAIGFKQGIIGMPRVVLGNDTIYLAPLEENGKTVKVYHKTGVTSDVPFDDVAKMLNDYAVRTKASMDERYKTKVFVKPEMAITIPSFEIKTSKEVNEGNISEYCDNPNNQCSINLTTESGKTVSGYLSPTDESMRLKTIDRFIQFINDNAGEKIRATTYNNDRVNDAYAIKLATAYSKYLNHVSGKEVQPDNPSVWKAFQKELSGINMMENKFIPATLIVNKFTKEVDGKKIESVSVDRVVASSNKGFDNLYQSIDYVKSFLAGKTFNQEANIKAPATTISVVEQVVPEPVLDQEIAGHPIDNDNDMRYSSNF